MTKITQNNILSILMTFKSILMTFKGHTKSLHIIYNVSVVFLWCLYSVPVVPVGFTTARNQTCCGQAVISTSVVSLRKSVTRKQQFFGQLSIVFIGFEMKKFVTPAFVLLAIVIIAVPNTAQARNWVAMSLEPSMH
jgi:hypothetical protein